MLKKKPSHSLDQPLDRKGGQVSLSAFSFLFSAIVQQAQQRSSRLVELEDRLSALGFSLGAPILELIMLRERPQKRDLTILGMLSFIHSNVWRALFGKPADSLEKGTGSNDEYMIVDKDSLVNKFISVPRELSSLNCAEFVAGIVHGILEAADFPCDKVSAHLVVNEETQESKTVVLIKFSAKCAHLLAEAG